MKFFISRATTEAGHKRGEQPHPNAVYESGDGHERKWSIEVSTLEELLELAKIEREGVIVSCDESPSITIYDGYIE